MIKYLTRNKIDIEKYDTCIENSINSRIYAYSWYLDCVADNWDALILNDYKAVMPLPKRKKYGLNYIYLPPWVQQLGVFSDKEISKDLIKDFINEIPKKFVLVDYFFNSGNRFSHKNVKVRDNYVLDLNKGFEEIRKGYNINRKRISNKDFTHFKIDKKGNAVEFLKGYKSIEKNYTTHKDSLETLQNLISRNSESIHIWNVYKNEELIAGLVWFKDSIRITYLVPIATEQAKKENIPTYLVNELIKEYQKTQYVLDFEGSMIEGIAKFYKSFGVEREGYFYLKRKLMFQSFTTFL